ncbi:antibiotic biosynthesis monooxygenase [Tamaricihabitans halophyticus]|uniref:Antibiotic biosynthesis monooxygenase n=2 Tax=Tamaricihabitans halophyticus TaxID=1262583 RepID=A0A4R2QYZ9_9PSEU|nr:antibiotic biosynthesis monooxygenase [Tamaricihabitans halophyticus]
MLLVCRFAVSEAEVAEFTERVAGALELLTAQPGCARGVLGRSMEQPERWVLSVEFDSVVAYRKALGPFEVRERVVPLLAEALLDEPADYEVLVHAEGGASGRQVSVLAADAGTVRIGEASGPASPRSAG